MSEQVEERGYPIVEFSGNSVSIKKEGGGPMLLLTKEQYKKLKQGKYDPKQKKVPSKPS